ncbi:MAG: hypothetical protein A3A94_00175 [Candidatus Portnoybacteria bacterium RIFCSPLOWO2_01_FULL_43_11]|uniref:DUF4352 domain-containing protein n=3 Tax=Candidatus Portnoyibacteriota TaxID=1817913 RepID=A0A1G2FB53_9BACT|nr:MAG: hypothetical protein A2815_02325 [Candidatus Portnoybacteria bacterium RIFCSPHIGHO2_01_FULL_40_12b]OGZ38965.1 MAG: hypothetical protein A3A94_00175 [Candidatus Portnoybacteria bacterium RIFCSPLOWO2_01_FULL_43_11]OGZ40504.1 MAG: hypothetical protein A3I20_00440 [Candidatus Portnoybacteria bacterium RIFCSPLOWO2_02_FULL_40_15]
MKKISYLFLAFILIFSQAQILSAFEAHIINVTATIVRDPGGKTSLDISKTVELVCFHKCGKKKDTYSISGRILIENTGEYPALVSGVSDVVWYKIKGDNPWQETVSDISTDVPSIIPVNDGLPQEFSYSGTFELPEGISSDDVSLRNKLEITISNHPDGEHTFHTEQSFEISEDQKSCPDHDDWDNWEDDDWDDWGDDDWDWDDWGDKDDKDWENWDDEDWKDKDWENEDGDDWRGWAMNNKTNIDANADFSSTTITLISANATTTINITAATAPNFENDKEITDKTEQETEQTNQETEEGPKEEPFKEPAEESIEGIEAQAEGTNS